MADLQAPAHCPACGGPLHLRRLACAACGTEIEGRFQPGRLGRLSREQQEFVEVFVVCRGNIREVERVLGVSYPTVRSRLESCIEAMGYDPGAASAAFAGSSDSREAAAERRAVLDALEKGEIDAEEAMARLRGLRRG